LEEGRARLGSGRGAAGSTLMALAPAITDVEQLKGHPAVAQLLAWNAAAVTGVKFDRDEMTIYIDRSNIREACALLRDDANCAFNFLSDVTCVDWYPAEPRFEVIYHLLSIPNKERVRLKVRLHSANPVVESLTPVWPGANYFEREVFDLFGIRFTGHPYLLRLLMPEDWEGHPLRKDYPVEGYR
jgi:NADH-quinone oxidoreductase subunit C